MKKVCFLLIAVLVVSLGVQAADEITVTTTLKVKNGAFDLTRFVSNLKIDQTGNASSYAIQAVTTNSTTLQVNSDLTIAGYSFMRNLSTTNDVEVTVTLLFKPGDVAVFRAGSTNITAQVINTTNSPSVNFEYWINEE